MEQLFNISVFTENKIGLLNRITIIFTRRHLNIESITASESEIKGIHRYTIVVKCTEEQVKKVVGQIEKQVEVLIAFYHPDEDVVYQEIGLFKLSMEGFVKDSAVERIVRSHHIRILTMEKEFVVLEKTGRPEEMSLLFNELKPYGLLEFVRSGRVVVTKPMKTLEKHLNGKYKNALNYI